MEETDSEDELDLEEVKDLTDYVIVISNNTQYQINLDGRFPTTNYYLWPVPNVLLQLQTVPPSTLSEYQQ